MRAAMAGIATTAALAAALGAWGCGNSGSSEGDGGAGGDTDVDTDVECAWRVMIGPDEEPHEGRFWGMTVCGPDEAYIVAGYPTEDDKSSEILELQDGQWSKLPEQPEGFGSNRYFSEMFCVEPGFVIGVGGEESNTGAVAIYENETWTWQDLPEVPPLTEVYADSPKNIYTTGDEGTVVHYDGESWISEQLPEVHEDLELRAVWCSGNEAFVGGDFNIYTCYVCHKSGGVWQRLEMSDLWTRPLSFWGTGLSDLYLGFIADGPDQTMLLKWEEGEWVPFEEYWYDEQIDHGFSMIADMWGLSIDDLYAVEYYYRNLWHKEGDSWQLVLSPDVQLDGIYPRIDEVMGSSGENVFATGNGIYRYSCE